MSRAALWATLVLAGSAIGSACRAEQAALQVEEVTVLGPNQFQTRFYPAIALKAGMEGRAVVRCLADGHGVLANYEILEESPAGYMFGEAAVRLWTGGRIKSKTKTGEPVAGRFVDLKASFRLPR